MRPKSFRKFIEDTERQASSPHLDALGDEMGIDARDIEKEPMVASFFAMGDEVRNIGTYRVVSFKRDQSGRITHAVVERFNDKAIKDRRYRDEDGNMVRTQGGEGNERMLVPIEDLDKLMSQSLQPPASGAEGMA